MNGREKQIQRNATKNMTPAGSYGGGEDFGSPFGGGAGQPPGRANEAAVPYGGPPSAYPPAVDPPLIGGGTDTGSGSSGGSPGGSSGAAGKFSGLSLDQIRLFNQITGANVDILETKGGAENLWAKSRAGLTQDDAYTMKTLEDIDVNPEYNENYKINTDIFTDKNTNPDAAQDGTWKSPEWDVGSGKVGLQEGAMTYTNPNIFGGTQFSTGPTFQNQNFGWKVGAKIPFQQGGPVGLMSLPQGYENGGEVIEGEDTMEELTPFGGTRERVIDQVEAFDNAPHHIEEPMIGMWGEKIPLTTARRVQKYMQGLDPVKRGLIEEMMQMFSMKKMMEKQQDQQEKGQYFGSLPEAYNI